ncbi:hypothetical protein D9611_011040 [Ephemerocybe angulata]|uniref:Dihydroxy-acid dehydratase n=1 Tax=Ephemerocybe angulata TaxID=980116 RepID=A0A8H5BB10_9AGAR|nr:hypothetical protein D9611_011040 [Tulosesus angulatus]
MHSLSVRNVWLRSSRTFSTSVRAAADNVVMNRYSRIITQPKDQGASQAMLYATDGIASDDDFNKAMVGVASVWYEGNPCNKHLLGLGQEVKASLIEAGLIGYQFGTVGVSDGISMGTGGMRYSLQSRDLIADQVETAAGGHHLDGMVTIPGCDKNMPGVLMALGRLNRPGLMVYGGTIRAGSCEGQPQLDIVSAFQAYGKYLQDGKTDKAESERYSTIRHSCPGPGACGGMYTANTMASAAEALGMTIPGSSSFPAQSQEKHDECASVGGVMRNLLEKNILPRDIMTRSAFETAMVLTVILGGSTNAVLHLIAMAHSVGIKLDIDDFQTISDRTPFLADLKPSGKYVMEDVYKLGGIPKILHFLLKEKLIDGNNMTVTGLTLGENLDRWVHKYGELGFHKQDVIRPLDKPIKETGHIRSVTSPSALQDLITSQILKGNLAPGGAVAKITGKEGLGFVGKARVFDVENDFVKAVESGSIKKGEKTVVILRYLGPKGGPGEPLFHPLLWLFTLLYFVVRLPSRSGGGFYLSATALLPSLCSIRVNRRQRKLTQNESGCGDGDGDFGCFSAARFAPGWVYLPDPPHLFWQVSFRLNLRSAQSHGFVIGHVVPEAQVGGPIALVRDGDVIRVDAVKNSLEVDVSDEEMARRRAEWVAPPLKVSSGALYKYAKLVTDASHGCVTDA